MFIDELLKIVEILIINVWYVRIRIRMLAKFLTGTYCMIDNRWRLRQNTLNKFPIVESHRTIV